MKTVFPDYYKDFRCIAHKCRHNCCIGWEIDIDPETYSFYSSLEGDFGEKLRANIREVESPHFILAEEERCPFLNSCNLCDIHINLGEDKLCSICTEHPRFYNETPTHREAGLGLSCEEAARLIITRKEPLRLVDLPENPDYVTEIREDIFSILQNRNQDIDQRIDSLAHYLKDSFINTDISEILNHNVITFLPLFEGLEQMDKSWGNVLSLAHKEYSQDEFADFDYHIYANSRETEYEQFLCYLVYRHMPKAEFAEDVALYSAFAVLSYRFVRFLGAVIFAETRSFTTEDQLELMRLFSAEIEYSDENPDTILDFIEKTIFGS